MVKIRHIIGFLYVLLVFPIILTTLGIPNTGITHLIVLTIATLPLGNRNIRISKTHVILILLIVVFSISQFYVIQNNRPLEFLVGWILTFYFLLIQIISSLKYVNIIETYKLLTLINKINLLGILFTVIFMATTQTTFREAITIFRDLSNYGTFVAISTILNFAFFALSKKKIYLNIVVGLMIISLLTTLKKLIIQELIIIIIAQLYFRFPLKEYVRKLLFIIPFGIIMSVPILTNSTQVFNKFSESGAENDIRGIMYISAIDIATNYFPFGSGYGTFGSIPSIYSMPDFEIDLHTNYYFYGLDKIGDNLIRLKSGLSSLFFDTFFPHVIGESGVLGLLIWFLAFLYPYFKLKKRKGLLSSKFIVFSLSSVILVEGLFLFTPEIPVFLFFTSYISILLSSSNDGQEFKGVNSY